MIISEIKNNINTINSVLSLDSLVFNQEIDTYFDLINNFKSHFSIFESILIDIKNINQNNIEFVFSCRVDDIFMIKKDDIINEEDPLVYIQVEENWVSYEFNLSTLFLTEYVNWLSINLKNTIEIHFSGYGIYVPIKKMWTLLLNPIGYPSKIWVSNELKTILLIQNECNIIKCISNNLQSIETTKRLLCIE